MKKLKLSIKVVIICALASANAVASSNSGRETLSFNKGWRFHQGDIAFPKIEGHDMTYSSCKAGKAYGAAAPEYDDSEWRVLSLPHDWSVENKIDSTESVSQGYRVRGIGWYRRNFVLPETDKGKHLELQFEGIASHCTVWLNGTLVHRNWTGYGSFYLDMTAFAKYGAEQNNIAIRVDASVQEGWWYEGAGIYRNTWLVKRLPVHIATDGVYANPVKTNGKWNIPVEVTLENSGKLKSNAEVLVQLIDYKGNKIKENKASIDVMELEKSVTKMNIAVENPQLWSIEEPTLYAVKTLVRTNGVVIDSLITYCGFRTIRFTPNEGFFLNDKPVKIKGTCNHQDHAGVGVAVPASIWEFRLRKLKEMGSNAVRCSHNAPPVEYLEACDRMGILVMDENRHFNISPEYMRQLEWMVRRDRNHPSIILWSVFNEEPIQDTEAGYEMVRRMSKTVKNLDTTRPVTAAMNGGFFTPKNVSSAVDVVGFNYQINDYDRFHKEHPELCLTSSEDVSGLMQRGQYVTDKSKNLLDEYDTQAPGWGVTHRVAWKAIAERPFLAGCFIWTGFDYRGEPTPFTWPTVGSNFGIMDACGFPKTAYYLHQAQWIENKPVLQLVPHWNWPSDSIGKKIRVMVLSNADKVKVMLNGKILFEKPVDKYEMLTENVAYKPGKLEAIGYKNGKEVSHFSVETTGKPVALELVPDRSTINNDGSDAIPVIIRTLDAKGRVVATANFPVEFEVNGSGNIIGVGNGNPNSHDSEKGTKVMLFNGLAQLIIQSKAEGKEMITLTAKSPGLKPTTITINLLEVKQIGTLDIADQKMTINRWKIAPFSSSRIEPNQQIAANDQNTWEPTRSGQLISLKDGIFTVYRADFKPFLSEQRKGAKLILKDVVGKAEVWIDNQLLKSKTTFEKADLEVILPPKAGNRRINVLIETVQNQKAGLGGMVSVEKL